MSLAQPSRTILVEPVEVPEKAPAQAPPPPDPPRRVKGEPQPAKA
jgi:hypothetical protein